MAWIRIHMDPELLPGSGSRTLKIQSWIRIRIRNKSFRIHNTAFVYSLFEIFEYTGLYFFNFYWFLYDDMVFLFCPVVPLWGGAERQQHPGHLHGHCLHVRGGRDGGGHGGRICGRQDGPPERAHPQPGQAL